jgi:hypothetical protein
MVRSVQANYTQRCTRSQWWRVMMNLWPEAGRARRRRTFSKPLTSRATDRHAQKKRWGEGRPPVMYSSRKKTFWRKEAKVDDPVVISLAILILLIAFLLLLPSLV